MPTLSSAAIVSSMKTRLTEIRAEAEQLEKAIAILEVLDSPAPAAAEKSRARRTPVPDTRLITAARSLGMFTTAQFAEQTGIDPANASKRLHKLAQARKGGLKPVVRNIERGQWRYILPDEQERGVTSRVNGGDPSEKEAPGSKAGGTPVPNTGRRRKPQDEVTT